MKNSEYGKRLTGQRRISSRFTTKRPGRPELKLLNPCLLDSSGVLVLGILKALNEIVHEAAAFRRGKPECLVE